MKHLWTPDEVQRLTALYPDTKTTKIAALLGISAPSVYNKAFGLGLRKSAAYLRSPEAGRTDGKRGSSTRFAKGQTPWNKGASYAPGGRSVETRFQPGHRGGKAVDLYRPIGSERISKDGYLQRKVNDDMPLQRRWRGVHLIVWESANGPLPVGHVVTFMDGNKLNTSPENLRLVTRAELMRRNTVHNYGPEIAQIVRLRGNITRQINKRAKP